MDFSSKGVNPRGNANGNIDATPSPPGGVSGQKWSASQQPNSTKNVVRTKRRLKRESDGGSIRQTRRTCCAAATPARPPLKPQAPSRTEPGGLRVRPGRARLGA